MDLLVNCSDCHTVLCLPEGTESIRCVICQAVTQVDLTGSVPSPNSHNTISRMPVGHLQVHGKKRALVCAVSYKGTKNELKGCDNDAKCMKFMLINRFKFPEASVLYLTGKFLKPFLPESLLILFFFSSWLIRFWNFLFFKRKKLILTRYQRSKT